MLTKILTELLSKPTASNHKLRGGLWLNWRPTDQLIISRPDIPPSENELKVTINTLQAMGYTTYTRKLTKKTTPTGIDWFGWPIQIAKQDVLL